MGNANPLAPSIQLNSPAEDESWVVDSTHNISWSSTGGVGQVKVTLEYSSTGNDPWLNIASDLSSSGSSTWKMPDSIVSNFYVRVTVADSALPPNTASTISQIQVVQPSAISSSSSSPSSSSSIPEFPAMPILFVFMLVLVFFSVLLRKFLE